MKSMMKKLLIIISMGLVAIEANGQADYSNNQDFQIKSISVTHDITLRQTTWKIQVNGKAGSTRPEPIGQMNGAPVLGYVFPTTLSPVDVGFNNTSGIVALALTAHPDFDDTPLWDENMDGNYTNDGLSWHAHWVVLSKNKKVKGGLAVKQFEANDNEVSLPPTNPGMPMYMDSPGFQVITSGNNIFVSIPDFRLNNNLDFKYDGVTCFMKVNTKLPDLPLLGVYEVYSIASGDLSLPFMVKNSL
jgi:hypothetical protein